MLFAVFVIVVSAQMHIYISQTDRGEILIGAEIEPYSTYSGRSTFPFLEYSSRHKLELFPPLERAKVLRQWTGLCDPSPTTARFSGKPSSKTFRSAPAGARMASRAPIVGTMLAELVATRRTPELIAPFALERFYTDTWSRSLLLPSRTSAVNGDPRWPNIASVGLDSPRAVRHDRPLSAGATPRSRIWK
jgi:glycine/D-amino acid oxidase-like deaminating enzyme